MGISPMTEDIHNGLWFDLNLMSAYAALIEPIACIFERRRSRDPRTG
jgi:hypothetical protein